jgi:hypothetical protein
MRVILVSDTHLSPSAAEAQANWEAVLRYVAAAAPDVVLHIDRSRAGQLAAVPVPARARPGPPRGPLQPRAKRALPIEL